MWNARQAKLHGVLIDFGEFQTTYSSGGLFRTLVHRVKLHEYRKVLTGSYGQRCAGSTTCCVKATEDTRRSKPTVRQKRAVDPKALYDLTSSTGLRAQLLLIANC